MDKKTAIDFMDEVEQRGLIVGNTQEWLLGWEAASDDMLGEALEKTVRVAREWMGTLLRAENGTVGGGLICWEATLPGHKDWVRGYCDAVIWALEDYEDEPPDEFFGYDDAYWAYLASYEEEDDAI